MVMYNIKAPVQTQLFVPEILHLTTILVSTGPVTMRTAIHGIITSLVQSLIIGLRDGEDDNKDRLKRILRDCFKPEVLRLFGLVREDCSSEYIALDTSTEQLSVDSLERITTFLLDIVEAGAGSSGELALDMSNGLWLTNVNQAWQMSGELAGLAWSRPRLSNCRHIFNPELSLS